MQGFKPIPTPYLEQFETCMEIFCDVRSINWLVSYKREENSTKNGNNKGEFVNLEGNPYKGIPLARDSITLLKPPCETNHPVAYEILSIEIEQVTIGM